MHDKLMKLKTWGETAKLPTEFGFRAGLLIYLDRLWVTLAVILASFGLYVGYLSFKTHNVGAISTLPDLSQLVVYVSMSVYLLVRLISEYGERFGLFEYFPWLEKLRTFEEIRRREGPGAEHQREVTRKKIQLEE